MSEEENLRYTLWQCEICEDEFITDCKARHDMVWCKCGKTGVDAEEYYTRCIGEAKFLEQSSTEPIQRMGIEFRELNEEEEKDFRQWARDNYVAHSEINSVWHPTVRDECEIINQNKDE
jgi:hypothetical protein